MATVELPSSLRAAAGGAARLTVEGGTVNEIVAALVQAAPALGARLLAPNGTLKRTVGVFLNDEDVRDLPSGLEHAVGAADVLVIVAAMAGG